METDTLIAKITDIVLVVFCTTFLVSAACISTSQKKAVRDALYWSDRGCLFVRELPLAPGAAKPDIVPATEDEIDRKVGTLRQLCDIEHEVKPFLDTLLQEKASLRADGGAP